MYYPHDMSVERYKLVHYTRRAPDDMRGPFRKLRSLFTERQSGVTGCMMTLKEAEKLASGEDYSTAHLTARGLRLKRTEIQVDNTPPLTQPRVVKRYP